MDEVEAAFQAKPPLEGRAAVPRRQLEPSVSLATWNLSLTWQLAKQPLALHKAWGFPSLNKGQHCSHKLEDLKLAPFLLSSSGCPSFNRD